MPGAGGGERWRCDEAIPKRGRTMNDDTYCLFVILACMVTLAVPNAGQVIVAVFASALAVLAHVTPAPTSTGRPGHRDRHDVPGR